MTTPGYSTPGRRSASCCVVWSVPLGCWDRLQQYKTKQKEEIWPILPVVSYYKYTRTCKYIKYIPNINRSVTVNILNKSINHLYLIPEINNITKVINKYIGHMKLENINSESWKEILDTLLVGK